MQPPLLTPSCRCCSLSQCCVLSDYTLQLSSASVYYQIPRGDRNAHGKVVQCCKCGQKFLEVVNSLKGAKFVAFRNKPKNHFRILFTNMQLANNLFEEALDSTHTFFEEQEYTTRYTPQKRNHLRDCCKKQLIFSYNQILLL